MSLRSGIRNGMKLHGHRPMRQQQADARTGRLEQGSLRRGQETDRQGEEQDGKETYTGRTRGGMGCTVVSDCMGVWYRVTTTSSVSAIF